MTRRAVATDARRLRLRRRFLGCVGPSQAAQSTAPTSGAQSVARNYCESSLNDLRLVVPRRGAPLELRAQTALQLPGAPQDEDHADNPRRGVIARERRQRQADDKQ